MLQIAEAETLEEGTKHLALEFVITLAEARERAPGMIRKLPQFIKKLFEILMKMLLDVEDDPAWHSAEVEQEDAGESSNYSAGQECLDWYIVMTKSLEQVVFMVLNSFHDPHRRARWATINAIGQLYTDLGPDLQNQYHHLVLPALASTRDDLHNPRVQK